MRRLRLSVLRHNGHRLPHRAHLLLNHTSRVQCNRPQQRDNKVMREIGCGNTKMCLQPSRNVRCRMIRHSGGFHLDSNRF